MFRSAVSHAQTGHTIERDNVMSIYASAVRGFVYLWERSPSKYTKPDSTYGGPHWEFFRGILYEYTGSSICYSESWAHLESGFVPNFIFISPLNDSISIERYRLTYPNGEADFWHGNSWSKSDKPYYSHGFVVINITK